MLMLMLAWPIAAIVVAPLLIFASPWLHLRLLFAVIAGAAFLSLIAGTKWWQVLFAALFNLQLSIVAFATRRFILSLDERARLPPGGLAWLRGLAFLSAVFLSFAIMVVLLVPNPEAPPPSVKALSGLMGGPEAAIATVLLIGAAAFVTPPHWILSSAEREKILREHRLLFYSRLVGMAACGVAALAVVFFAPGGPVSKLPKIRAKEGMAGAITVASGRGELASVQDWEMHFRCTENQALAGSPTPTTEVP